jgi:hypothetical protein
MIKEETKTPIQDVLDIIELAREGEIDSDLRSIRYRVEQLLGKEKDFLAHTKAVKPLEVDPINDFALQALGVLAKVLHALQHSNMKGTILHDEISAAVTKGMNLPLKVKTT